MELGLIIPLMTRLEARLVREDEKQLARVTFSPETEVVHVVVGKVAEMRAGELSCRVEGKMMIMYPEAGIGSDRVSEKV